MKKVRKLLLLFLSTILLYGLLSCSQPEEEKSSSSYGDYTFPNATSLARTAVSNLYFEESKEELTTSYLTDWEDVPFLSSVELGKLLGYMNLRGYSIRSTENGFTYQYNPDGAEKAYPEAWKDDILYFDLVNQTIYSDEFVRIMSPTMNVNNGIGCDCVGLQSSAKSSFPVIRGSDSTRQVQKKGRTTIRLSDYGLKMFKIDNDIYVPFAVLAGICSQFGACTFNGKDYYLRFPLDADKSTALWTGYAEGYKGLGSRSQLMAEFNYRNLCLLFDVNYSLKNQRTAVGRDNISSFNDSIKKNNLYDKLISISTEAYDDGLLSFLLAYIDDGHTQYVSPSLWQSKPDWKTVGEKANERTGSRRKAIGDTFKRLKEARSKAGGKAGAWWVADTEGNKKLAVITFDGFVNGDPGDETDLEILSERNTYAFFKTAFSKIQSMDTDNSIKNVVLDLTNNGGGLLKQCLLVLSFLASPSDFCIPVRNYLDSSITKYYYEIGENLKQNYNFYILTSSASFSCGNLLPSICKYQLSIPVIGQKSGGGGGTVKETQTSDGALFKTSAAMEMCALDKDSKYISIDTGIPVDLEIPESDFYSGSDVNQALYYNLYKTLSTSEKYSGNFQ